jgi:hypothetical protein
MPSFVTLFRDFYPGQRHSARLKLALALVLVVLADWLFYQGDGWAYRSCFLLPP